MKTSFSSVVLLSILLACALGKYAVGGCIGNIAYGEKIVSALYTGPVRVHAGVVCKYIVVNTCIISK